MKNFKILSLTLLVFAFSSCGLFQNAQKKVEKTLIGKWDFTFVKSASAGEVTAEYEKLMQDLLKDSFFTFNADKTYGITLMGEQIEGTWAVSDDGNYVLTNEEETKLEIIEISKEKLVLSSKTDEDIITMYLKK